MAFPDPTTPIATCSAITCKDCPVAEKIHCHFKFNDLVHFLLISLPGFIVGGAAIFSFSPWALVIYLGVVIGFFGFLEIRVMCSHCPHYAEGGSTLTCWANHGSLKLWKYRPGPMTRAETLWFLAGLTVVGIYPLPFLILTKAWFLLILYVLTSSGFMVTLKIFLCSKCMNFACPFNSVDKVTRELFLMRNPAVAKFWKKHDLRE